MEVSEIVPVMAEHMAIALFSGYDFYEQWNHYWLNLKIVSKIKIVVFIKPVMIVRLDEKRGQWDCINDDEAEEEELDDGGIWLG